MPSMGKKHSHLDRDNNITMNLKLIKGRFDRQDARDLIFKMVQTKIKFQEEKIHQSAVHHNEEDIKMREKRIIDLQNELSELLKKIDQADSGVEITASIEIRDGKDL